MESSSNVSVPNFFYDLIVFVGPSLLFLGLLLYGFGVVTADNISGISASVGAGSAALFTLFALFFGYEYGRTAEALSSPIVAGLISFLVRKGLIPAGDYDLSLEDVVREMPIPVLRNSVGRPGSKWALYMYASVVSPDLGKDLLKRYAWEKLARSSAFTFVLLTLLSVICLTIRIVLPSCSSPMQNYLSDKPIASLIFLLSTLFLAIIAYFEYYKRNSWNNDLLIKSAPILLLASPPAKINN